MTIVGGYDYILSSRIGAPNGIPRLDASGNVLASEMGNAPFAPSNFLDPGFAVFNIKAVSVSVLAGKVVAQGTGGATVYPMGAVMDGVTDDRVAIGNAVAAASAVGGGTVYIPPGTLYTTYNPTPSNLGAYRTSIRCSLVLPSKVRLLGAGAGLTIWKFDDYIGVESACIGVATGTSYFSVQGISFNGQHTGTAEVGDYCIIVSGGSDFQVTDCEFYQLGTKGVLVGHSLGDISRRFSIARNNVRNISGNALGVNQGYDWEIVDNFVHDTNAVSGAEAIPCTTNGRFLIARNIIYNWGDISMTGVDGEIVDNYISCSATNLTIQTCIGIGTDTAGQVCQRVKIARNIIDGSNATSGSISLQRSGAGTMSDIEVSNNTVIGTGAVPSLPIFTVGNMTNIDIKNNRVIAGGSPSIKITGGAVGGSIDGNRVDNGIQLSGSGFIARNNVGLNPVGVVVVSVPASTVAVAADQFDRTFYITTAAGVSTFAIQGGPTITIPPSSLGTIRVPAGQTMTPTYANPPTWVVEGE